MQKNRELLYVQEKYYKELIKNLNAQPEDIQKIVRTQVEKIEKTLKPLNNRQNKAFDSVKNMFALIEAKSEAQNIFSAKNNSRNTDKSIGYERD